MFRPLSVAILRDYQHFRANTALLYGLSKINYKGQSAIKRTMYNIKRKDKGTVHPITGHESPEGE
jgi:hypothetical protein